MSGDEQYINAIDKLAEIQQNLEAKTGELIGSIGKLVVAVAANEAIYDIESSSTWAEKDSLTTTAEAVTSTRQTLNDTIEDAIKISKQGFLTRHQQSVLRNELLKDFPTNPEG